MLQPGVDDQLDWTWIDARRRSDLDDEEVFRFAPPAWRQWVEDGPSSLAQIRRIEPNLKGSVDWGVSQTLAELRERVMPVEAARNWLSARVIEGILVDGGARIRIEAHDRESPVHGVMSLGTSLASVDVKIKGRLETDPYAATQGVERLGSMLRPGEIGVDVVWCDTRPSFHEVVARSFPVIVVTPEALAAQALRIADNSFGGDVHRLVGRALQETQDV